ncbi:MAG: hypothetical protein IJJ33_01480 [Victivallales bacterium]|nr:hypothetical protein [Victivallales bacterium]
MKSGKPRMSGRFRVHAVLLCGMLLLASCQLFVTRLPPGFSRSGGVVAPHYPKDTSDEAIYSFIIWFRSTEAGIALAPKWASQIVQVQSDIGDRLFDRWQQAVIAHASPLVKLEDGVIRLAPLVFSQNVSLEQGATLLQDLHAMVAQPLEVIPPVPQAIPPAILQMFSKGEREDYGAWAAKSRLVVPDPAKFDRKALLKEIDRISVLVGLKKQIANELSELRNAVALDEFQQRALLERLTSLRKRLPDELSFAPLGDEATLAEFHEKLARLPLDCMASTLGRLEQLLSEEQHRLFGLQKTSDAALANVLTNVETDLASHLDEWRADERFAQALLKSQDRLSRLVASAADKRRQLWGDQLSDLRRRHEFWDAAVNYRQFHATLQDTTQPLRIYHSCNSVNGNGTWCNVLEESLDRLYMEMLPEGMDEYLSSAEHATNIDNHQGVALAICALALRLCELPDGAVLPKEILARREQAAALWERLRKRLEGNQLVRTISIGDMSSAMPGIGRTYSQDLAHELQVLLKSFGLSRLVVFPETESRPSQWGYVTFGGMVANFDGGESTERQAMKSIRRQGEVRRLSNPGYREDAPQNAPRSETSAVLYEQDVLLQVIHVKEIERLAHVRVFMNFRGPGFSTLVEVNEFYKKKFSVEESHPFLDVKVVETRKFFDAMRIAKQDPEPTLRYDRIWTAGEMLDWARRDSLRVAGLQLLYHISDYPLYLAEKAASAARAADYGSAVESLGQCCVLCLNTPVEDDLDTLLRTATPPVALAYEPTLGTLRRQRQALATLKANVEHQMLEAANLHLRQMRKANQTK